MGGQPRGDEASVRGSRPGTERESYLKKPARTDMNPAKKRRLEDKSRGRDVHQCKRKKKGAKRAIKVRGRTRGQTETALPHRLEAHPNG